MAFGMKVADSAAIRMTSLFRDLDAHHPGIEVWPDEGFTEGDWAYFWIVSRVESAVRNLTYVRLRQGQFQRRTYDDHGDDVWIDAE